jgi:hypothetical protein
VYSCRFIRPFPKVLLQGVIQAFVSALHLRVGLSWKPWNFLSVSARVLVDAVLAETGKSPSAWIRHRTLLEARRLLTLQRLDDLRNRLSAAGGCCARSLTWSASVKNLAESDKLTAFFRMVRV